MAHDAGIEEDTKKKIISFWNDRIFVLFQLFFFNYLKFQWVSINNGEKIENYNSDVYGCFL